MTETPPIESIARSVRAASKDQTPRVRNALLAHTGEVHHDTVDILKLVADAAKNMREGLGISPTALEHRIDEACFDLMAPQIAEEIASRQSAEIWQTLEEIDPMEKVLMIFPDGKPHPAEVRRSSGIPEAATQALIRHFRLDNVPRSSFTFDKDKPDRLIVKTIEAGQPNVREFQFSGFSRAAKEQDPHHTAAVYYPDGTIGFLAIDQAHNGQKCFLRVSHDQYNAIQTADALRKFIGEIGGFT